MDMLQAIPLLNNNNNNMVNNIIYDNNNNMNHFVNDHYDHIIENNIIQNNINNNNIQNDNIVNMINNNIHYNVLIEQIQHNINNIINNNNNNNNNNNIHHNVLIELIQNHIINNINNNINNNQYNNNDEFNDLPALIPGIAEVGAETVETAAAAGAGEVEAEVTDQYHMLGPEDSTEEKNIPKCSICLDNRCTIILIPCGHVCACTSCSHLIDKCPICRSSFVRRQALFFV